MERVKTPHDILRLGNYSRVRPGKWGNEEGLSSPFMQTIVYGKDYPVFFFIFVATATIMYKFIFQTKVSSNAKKVYAEKRKIIISAMNTALNWKQSAVQLRNTKVKEIEEKIERNDIAKNCKGVKTDKMENVDPDNELKKSQEQIE